ncbi:MAG: GntR family transcriptional regulator [Pseudomonadota bacterium]|nr:GntR family transcriptional regulator [Pseudomonadota bacterium]
MDSVHAVLRAAILDGALAPGQPLSVTELSRQLDVSHSPVREAVLALVADGLAVEQPRRGVAVAEVEPADLLEIHEVREGVEAQAARLCAKRAGDTVLRRLAEVLERQRAVVERDDARGWFETNADFHRFVVEGTGNRRLSEVVLALERQMRLGLRQISSDQEQRRRGLAEHLAVLDAITKREPEAAERLMREHIRRTKERLARLGRRPACCRASTACRYTRAAFRRPERL